MPDSAADSADAAPLPDAAAIDLGGHAVDMSMLGLFLAAGPVVKAVMLALFIASVWSWAIIGRKWIALRRLSRAAARFEDAFWSGEPLDKLYARVKNARGEPLARVFVAGMGEWNEGLTRGLPARAELRAGLRQRIDRAMGVAIGREVHALERGMTFLASVGSTAPFVGLFGTVWGIMGAFTAIAGANNTSLAVVAPGIAEALLATAIGLVAAIPAVVAYNAFSTEVARYADRLEAFAEEFSAILSRHMDATREGPKPEKPGEKGPPDGH